MPSKAVEDTARYARVSLVHQWGSKPTSLYPRRDTQPCNDAYLSVVSVWEAIVKHDLGKLPLSEPAGQYLPRQRERHEISNLPLDEPSVVRLGSLPSLHRDPFDRMLVCQALQHELVVATADDAVRAYPVAVL